MRLLRRNTTGFMYRALTGETETLQDGMHTGNYEPTYGDPVQYRGNISAPSGFATDNLFGVNTQYTHVLVMDYTEVQIDEYGKIRWNGDPEVEINEYGKIRWNGDLYDIRAIRPSLNSVSIALRKQTKDHTEDEGEDGD